MFLLDCAYFFELRYGENFAFCRGNRGWPPKIQQTDKNSWLIGYKGAWGALQDRNSCKIEHSPYPTEKSRLSCKKAWGNLI